MGDKSLNAPVALFVYNRPDHLERAIGALLKCPEVHESPFYVFCDGPKNSAASAAVERTRDIAKRMSPAHAQFVISDVNKGLAASIEDGVRRLCEKYGRVIVIEDDLVVSPSFLKYMNAALEKYCHSTKVMQISGYMFPLQRSLADRRCALLPVTTSWGWATWKRAWQCYDPSARGWEALDRNNGEKIRFNMNGAFDFYAMLAQQMRGISDSWAIRWYWSVFRNQGLVLYPPASLVENTGFDGSGTHGWRASRAGLKIIEAIRLDDVKFPEDEICDAGIYTEIVEYMGSRQKGTFAGIRALIKGYVYSLRTMKRK